MSKIKSHVSELTDVATTLHLSTNRVEYIDIAKGIGISLVLVGHLPVNHILLNLIYGFHMPLFFYLSGIFVSDSNFKKVIQKNIGFVYTYFLLGLFFIFLASWRKDVLQVDAIFYLVKTAPLEIWRIQWFGAAWFLLSFFVVKVLTNFYAFRFLTVGVLFFLVSYYANLYFDEVLLEFPMCVGPALMLMIFYNVGKLNNNIIKLYSKKSLLLVLVFFLILNLMVIYIFDGTQEKLVNYHQMKVIYNPLLGLMVAITGIFFIIYLSKFIEHTSKTVSNILSFFGQYSLFIYLSHLFFFYVFRKVTQLYLPLQLNAYLDNIFIVIMTLGLNVLLIKLYQKTNKKFKYE